MEIEVEKPAWLNPDHTNYKRWERARELALDRAKIAGEIISSYKICKDLNILDLGSGEGRTSSYFSQNNKVISFDLSLTRLKRQQSSESNSPLINGAAEFLPFKNLSFDLIILQDVIEHVEDKDSLVNELKRILKKNGLIYISTPNRFSIFNFISDPHWGIPFLSLFKRPSIKKYFLRFIRKDDYNRNDIAELLSLKDISILFNEYKINLNTKKITDLLSEDSKGILWSNFHLFLYRIIKKSGLIIFIKKMSNDKPGIINNLFAPTFYIVLTLK
jgi:SAM-dependent methyltransferase